MPDIITTSVRLYTSCFIRSRMRQKMNAGLHYPDFDTTISTAKSTLYGTRSNVCTLKY